MPVRRAAACLWACALLAAPAARASWDDDRWRARVENGRVVGHVDHPHEIELEGRRFHIIHDELTSVDRRAPARRGAATLATGAGSAEYLVKLSAPVHEATVAAIHALVAAAAEAADVHGGAPRVPAWVEHAARNTLIIHAPAHVAEKIAREVRHVVWVGPVDDTTAPYLKLHHSIWEQRLRQPAHPAAGRSQRAATLLEAPVRGPQMSTGEAKVSDVDASKLLVGLRRAVEENEALLNAVEAKITGVVAGLTPAACPAATVTRDGGYVAVAQGEGVCGCEGVDLWEVAVRLATHPDFTGLIHTVEHPGRAKIANKYGRELMTTGRYHAAINATLDQREPYAHLQGEGMVVGVADTGIDHDHCFFFDPEQATPIDSINRHHRKIVRYKSWDSSVEGRSDWDHHDGHGTHVAATIAGSLTPEALEKHPEMAGYHGFVPKARVTMIDLAGVGGSADAISLPSNTMTGIYGVSRDVGAQVYSNSWGSMTHGRYSSLSGQLDRFASEHPESVVLIAAGNEADKACISDPTDPHCDKSTIISPATAKSGLTVGASFAPQQSWEEMGLGNYFLNFTDAEVPRNFSIQRGYFGNRYPGLPSSVEVVVADPYDGCDPHDNGSHRKGKLHNAAAMKGNIALVLRGVCFFAVKIKELQDAGAAAVIVVNNVPGDPIVMGVDAGSDGDQLTVPAFMISDVDGEAVRKLVEGNADLAFSIALSHTRNPHKTEQDMSEFSSRGPTQDLRFKPDVVAIGYYVHSARSDSNLNTHNCDLSAQMGTSMATPEASGLTAKIIEHITKENLVSGTPSGALVRSLVVQSAVPLRGMVDRNAQGDWENLEPGPGPDFYQGHGRIQLNTILSLPDRPVDLALHDNQETSVGDGVAWQCVAYDTAQEDLGEWIPEKFGRLGFRATLAWTDPPSGGTSKHQAVNDLDLVVKTPAGRVHMGNARGDPSEHVKDSINLIEKAWVPNADSGVYLVGVRGFSLAGSGTQKYAVSASGRALPADDPRCQERMADKACVDSSFCDAANTAGELVDVAGASGAARLAVWEWRTFRYISAGDVKGISVAVDVEDNRADVDIYIKKGAPPHFTSYDQHYDSTCSVCYGNPQKTLSHRPQVDAEGDVYFISLHVGCCHPTNVTYKIEIDGDTPPDAPSIARMHKENAPQSDLVRFTSGESFTGGILVIGGAGFGTEEEQAGLAVTYQDDNGRTLTCEPTHFISETLVKCRTQPGSFEVSGSRVELTINGYSTKSPGRIMFEPVTPDRYTVFGLRATPCSREELDAQACGPNTRTIAFNSYIAAEGGGEIYIVGTNVGEVMPLSKKPAARVVLFTEGGTPDAPDEEAKQIETIPSEYISPDVLKVTTKPRMAGATFNIKIMIFGLEILDTDTTIVFDGQAALTGVSRISDLMPHAHVIYSYPEVLGKEPAQLRLYGVNIEDTIVAPQSEGRTSKYETPPKNLKVSIGRFPGVEDVECTLKDPQPGRVVCVLPSDEGLFLFDENLYFKITKYDRAAIAPKDAVSLFIVGRPSIDGVGLHANGPFQHGLALPSYFPTLPDANRRLYIHGKKFGTQSEFVMLTFTPADGQPGSNCFGSFVSDEVLECTVDKDVFFNATPDATYFIGAAIGGFIIDSDVTVALSDGGGVQGVALSGDGPWVDVLAIPAEATEIFVRGPWGDDAHPPTVVFGEHYNCGGGATDGDGVYRCTPAAGAVGKDLKVQVFVNGADIAAGKLKVTFENTDPAGSEPMELKFSTTPLFVGQPFRVGKVMPDGSVAYPPLKDQNVDALLALSAGDDACYKLALTSAAADPSVMTFPLFGFQNADALPIVPYTAAVNPVRRVCVSVQPGVWRAADPEYMTVVSVDALAVCDRETLTVGDASSAAACGQHWDLSAGGLGQTVVSGRIPPSTRFSIAVFGSGLPDTARVALVDGPCAGIDAHTHRALWFTEIPQAGPLPLPLPLPGANGEPAAAAGGPPTTAVQLFTIAHPKAQGMVDAAKWTMCYVVEEEGEGVKQETPPHVGETLAVLEATACLYHADAAEAPSPFCSGRGVCEADGSCLCPLGVNGAQCEFRCPHAPHVWGGSAADRAAAVCSGAGLCNAGGECECTDGYYGRDCAIAIKERLGMTLNAEHMFPVRARGQSPKATAWDVYAIDFEGREVTALKVYMRLAYESPDGAFDVMLWDDTGALGNAVAAVAAVHDLRAAPAETAAPSEGSDAAPTTRGAVSVLEGDAVAATASTEGLSNAYAVFDVPVRAGVSSVYVGVFPFAKSQPQLVYEVAFSTLPPAQWATPPPASDYEKAFNRMESFSHDYKVLAVVFGVVIGIVVVGLLAVLGRLFVVPVVRLMRQQRPQQLEDDVVEGDEMRVEHS